MATAYIAIVGVYRRYLRDTSTCGCTLKRISNWPPSFCYILGKVFGEKYE